jgi:uncharacterized protein (DUF983 family)
MTSSFQPPTLELLRGRCPRCHKGKLYDGFLNIAPSCTVCHLDYSFADPGDGPAQFIIFGIGALVLGAALALEIAVEPPFWVHFMLWLPLATVLSLLCLRPLKSLMVHTQYRIMKNKHDHE